MGLILVGIDPGTQTGVALWDKPYQNYIEIKTMKIHNALKYVEEWSLRHVLQMYIEDPNTWKPFGKKVDKSRLQGAGSIKRDFAIWRDFCEEKKIEMIPVKLQGTTKKIDSRYFNKLTGWDIKTSQHARDAAMLVFKR